MDIETLVRTVGKRKPGQCIWGFINGIHNTKEEALESAGMISAAADGEAVYSLPNDTALLGIKDLVETAMLKLTITTPIVLWAAQFFRYLLSLAQEDKIRPPVILFAHSQGAIITEHAV